MATNFSVVSHYEDNGLQGGLKQTVISLRDVDKATKQTTSSIKKIDKQQEHFIQTVSNAKKQYAQMKKQIQDLTLTYRSLTDEQKRSAQGVELEKKLEALKQRASEFLDTIGDVNEELKHLASDTQFTDGIGAYTRIMGNFMSVMTVAAGDSEHLKDVLLSLAQIQTVVVAVEQFTAAFQKQNRVLLMNPYAAATALIIGLGFALYKATASAYEYKNAIDAADASTSDFANNSLPSLIRQLKAKTQVEQLTAKFNDLQDQLEANEKAQERLKNPEKFKFGNISQAIRQWKDAGNTIDDLQEKHSELKKQQQQVFTQLHDLTTETQNHTRTTKVLNGVIKPTTSNVRQYDNSLKVLYKSLADIESINQEIMKSTPNLWKDAYKDLARDAMKGKALSPVGIDLVANASLESDDSVFDDMAEKFAKLSKEQQKLFDDAVKGGKSMAEAYTLVTSSVNSTANAWGSVAQMASAAAGAINGVSDSQEAQYAAWAVQSAGMIAQTVSQIMSLKAQALAGAAASGAKLPFPANLAAIAAGVATVAGIFSSLPKFADGGIVGKTSVGDFGLARVNGSEMILNGHQQENLFRILQGQHSISATPSVGQVEFKLRGQELVGVIKNYNSKMSKI